MKVLVTGSTGFIGAHLCRALVQGGHEVRAFHRASSTLRLIEDLPLEHAIGDLAQLETIQEAIQGVDAIYHVAALLGGQAAPGRMYTITVEGTRAILQAARAAGVKRLVYTSSVAALGVPEKPPSGDSTAILLDENHSWNFAPQTWPYGYTKHLAELEVQRAVAQGLDAVIVNPAFVLGAGDIYRRSSSLIVQTAQKRIPGLVKGGLNVVHIKDVIAGHLAAFERGKRGERYILGGENMSIAKLIHLIADVVGVSPPELVIPTGLVRMLSLPLTVLRSFINAPVSGSLMHLAGRFFYYDIRKAQVALGLQPPAPAREAIQDAYDWFKEAGDLPERVEVETETIQTKNGDE
ncbi:MAG: NAD-dependent epimerase/dehydratase family protein [Anaerolineaceae bacterium]|nr:NAD-dependent epimerase/dehydratase family protein [Anaerolineaceae bacterium]